MRSHGPTYGQQLGSIERFLEYLRAWKLQCVLGGGFWIKVNDKNVIAVSCSEVIRGLLRGRWVEQASHFKCSQVAAGNGSVEVRELMTKAEVFDTIRMGNAEWTESALQALDHWMRMGEGWNTRTFAGSGGFPMEAFEDSHLLGLPEPYETEGESGAGTVNDAPNTEDQDELFKTSLF